MAISLKSIRYANIGGSDAPYVLDVATLNDKREWGLKIVEDDPWSQARGQLNLIDSISIAILSDESITLTKGTGARMPTEVIAVAETLATLAETTSSTDTATVPKLNKTVSFQISSNVTFEQF